MDNGMNRRRFLKGSLAACTLLFARWEKGAAQRIADDPAEKSYMLMPMISRFVTLDCVPAGGTPFRLDISTLDSGHVLACAG